MENRPKDDTHKEREAGDDTQNENHSAQTSAPNRGGRPAPADRDAGSLEHGELGGNFTEEGEDKEA